MQTANRLQSALRKGTSYGAWQMLAGTNLARCMSRSGVDWICVDTEHGNIDDASMHEAVQAIAATGVSPIVRVAADEGWMVKRALDSGAHGVIVPLLRTPADAQKIVKAAKFPPLGIRGFGSPFSMGAFAAGGKTPTSVEYLKQANDSLLTIIQIETKEALENVDAIAGTEGVDVLLVGLFDLGNSIGHPILGEMDEELKSAIEKIRIAAKEAGKYSAMYCTSGDQGRKYADAGFNMISVTGDVLAIQNYVTEQVERGKDSWAHAAFQGAASMASRVSGPYGK